MPSTSPQPTYAQLLSERVALQRQQLRVSSRDVNTMSSAGAPQSRGLHQPLASPTAIRSPLPARHCGKQQRSSVPSGLRALVPCKYFVQGYCRNGPTCPYSHNPALRELFGNSSSPAPSPFSTPRGPLQQALLLHPDVDNMGYEELLALQERVGHVKVGVPAETLKRLPCTVMRTEPSQDVDPCPICLDSFIMGSTVRILPCRHAFHKDCIDAWLAEHKQCPTCKAEVVAAAAQTSNGEPLFKTASELLQQLRELQHRGQRG